MSRHTRRPVLKPVPATQKSHREVERSTGVRRRLGPVCGPYVGLLVSRVQVTEIEPCMEYLGLYRAVIFS
jgi:hypothetical protein